MVLPYIPEEISELPRVAYFERISPPNNIVTEAYFFLSRFNKDQYCNEQIKKIDSKKVYPQILSFLEKALENPEMFYFISDRGTRAAGKETFRFFESTEVDNKLAVEIVIEDENETINEINFGTIDGLNPHEMCYEFKVIAEDSPRGEVWSFTRWHNSGTSGINCDCVDGFVDLEKPA